MRRSSGSSPLRPWPAKAADSVRAAHGSKLRQGRVLFRFVSLAAALALPLSGCGDKSPTHSPAVDPVGGGVIASANLGGGEFQFTLDSGEELTFPRATTRTLESTGSSEVGDLLIHGEDSAGAWVAILGELQPSEPALGRAWVGVAPAWLEESVVVFDSGLRLPRIDDLTISPTIRPPADSGYVDAGTFLVNEAGTVIELR
jgi:hypothetical protein